MIDEDGYRRVRAMPDPEPVEFDFPQCVYASWITPAMMREVEEG